MVHVRDTLGTDTRTTAADVMRPLLTLPADEPVYDALTTMHQRRSQFALVTDDQHLLGLVTMQDLLDRLLPDPHTLRSAATGLGRAGTRVRHEPIG